MSLWNYTIDDASPYVSYSPSNDVPAAADGWQTWYSRSHYRTTLDQTSQGDSYHITSSRNASASFQFYGTGIALYGVSNSSFDVIIDNGPRTAINSATSSDSSSLLYSSQKLTKGFHSLTLSAQPGNSMQSMAFDFAIASAPLDQDESAPLPIFYDISNTTTFAYSGSWELQTQNGVPNATVTAPFYQTTQVNASASFSFSGANAIVVKGLASSANGMYSVSLDGQTNTFNGTSLWMLPDALLYFRAGLDHSRTYQLTITNLSSRLCLNSMTVFKHEPRNAAVSPASGNPTPPPPKQSSTSRIGVIAGSVGGFLLLLIALGIFLWFRRRRSQKQLSFFKPKSKPIVPPRPPSDVISPMLATFSQGDNSIISGARSTYTGGSDIHSSTNLLKGSASHGRRSLLSDTSSNAALSVTQESQMGSFSGWQTGHTMPLPSLSSQHSSSSRSLGHQSGPSVGSSSQFSSSTHQTRQTSQHRLTVETSVSSVLEYGSPRRRIQGPSASDYIPMSPRGPLPNIPAPSYDTALQAPELYPDEVKHIPGVEFEEANDTYSSHRRARRYSALTSLTTRTAPPQYER